MSPVTRIVLLAVFAAMGVGLGEVVAGNWPARVIGGAFGLFAGHALLQLLRERIGELDESPREHDERD